MSSELRRIWNFGGAAMLWLASAMAMNGGETKDAFGLPVAEASLQDAFAEQPRNQQLEVFEVFTLPKDRLAEWIGDDLGDQQLYERFVVAKADGVTISRFLMLHTVSGRRSELTQGAEYLYSTEFDPPEVPQLLVIAGGGKPADSGSPKPKVERNPMNAGLGIMTTTTPTAAAMTVLDTVLAIDARDAGRQGQRDLEVAATTRRLEKNQQWHGTEQPVFRVAEIERTVRVMESQVRFLGTYGSSVATGTVAVLPGAVEMQSVAFLISHPRTLEAPAAKAATDEQKAAATEYQVRVEVLSTLPETLVSLGREGVDDTALRKLLLEAGQAEVECLLMARGKTGERLEVRSTDEFIYPTEYDPPELPQHLVIADSDLLQTLREGRETDPGLRPGQGASPSVGGFGLITATSPTAFELVPIGDQLEIEVTTGREFYDADLSLGITRLGALRNIVGIDHPTVSAQRLQTSVQGRWGRPVLIGTISPPHDTGTKVTTDTGRLWVAFLTVERR